MRQLFEIIDERAERGGIIMASQIPVGKWHERMVESTISDATIDRHIHNSYRIAQKERHEKKATDKDTRDGKNGERRWP